MDDDEWVEARDAAVQELMDWFTARAHLFGPVDGAEDTDGERVTVVGPLICDGVVCSISWADLGRPRSMSWDRSFKSPEMPRSEARGRGLDICDAFG